MKKKSLLLKKVIILFVGVIIPLLAASFFYLHRNNIKQREQTLSSIQANNATYISHLDESLQQAYSANQYTTQQKLLSNLAVTYPFFSTYERSLRLNLLQEQLYNICSASPFLESAHAYLFNYQTVYNSISYKHGSYQKLTGPENEFYQKLSAESGLIQYYLDPVYKAQTLSIIMSPPFCIPAYAVNLILSQESLEKYLAANSSYDNDYYLFHMQNGFHLSSLSTQKEKDAMQLLSQYDGQTEPFYQIVELDGETYVAFCDYVSYSHGTYIRFISYNSLMPVMQYSYYLLILFFSLVMLSCIIFFIGIYRMIHKPLTQLTTAFDEVEKGNFQVRITQTGNDDFAYLYHAFNDMAVHLEQLIEQGYSQKLLLQKAEMKQLQAQINPHFLYNSFFMLQGMIEVDPKEAQNITFVLASCFRYITKNSMDNVTLKEEYEHARNYAYIQGLRFEGRIQIILDPLPDEFSRIPVPKLILQPILENAFNYGLKNKEEDGLLQVSFHVQGDAVTIRIEDNGDELTDSTLAQLQTQLQATAHSSDGVEMSGILNIQRRLLIFSDYKDSFHVSRSTLNGLCVEILLQAR